MKSWTARIPSYVIYNGKIQKIADARTLTTNEVGEFMMGVKRHA